MEPHELNRMFEGLAPTAEQEEQGLRRLLQTGEGEERGMRGGIATH